MYDTLFFYQFTDNALNVASGIQVRKKETFLDNLKVIFASVYENRIAIMILTGNACSSDRLGVLNGGMPQSSQYKRMIAIVISTL